MSSHDSGSSRLMDGPFFMLLGGNGFPDNSVHIHKKGWKSIGHFYGNEDKCDQYPWVVTAVEYPNHLSISIAICNKTKYEVFNCRKMSPKELDNLVEHWFGSSITCPLTTNSCKSMLRGACVNGPERDTFRSTLAEALQQDQAEWRLFVAGGFSEPEIKELKKGLESYSLDHPLSMVTPPTNNPPKDSWVILPTHPMMQATMRALGNTQEWKQGTYKDLVTKNPISVSANNASLNVLEQVKAQLPNLDNRGQAILACMIDHWYKQTGGREYGKVCTIKLSGIIKKVGGCQRPTRERKREWLKQVRLLSCIDVTLTKRRYKNGKTVYGDRYKCPLIVRHWNSESSSIDGEMTETITYNVGRWVFESLGGKIEGNYGEPDEFIKLNSKILKESGVFLGLVYVMGARERLELQTIKKDPCHLVSVRLNALFQMAGLQVNHKNLGRQLDGILKKLDALVNEDVIKILVVTGNEGNPKERLETVTLTYRGVNLLSSASLPQQPKHCSESPIPNPRTLETQEVHPCEEKTHQVEEKVHQSEEDLGSNPVHNS